MTTPYATVLLSLFSSLKLRTLFSLLADWLSTCWALVLSQKCFHGAEFFWAFGNYSIPYLCIAQSFVTVIIKFIYWALCGGNLIYFTPSHPFCHGSILMLLFCCAEESLCVFLLEGFWSSYMDFLFPPYKLHCWPRTYIHNDLITRIVLVLSFV